MQSGSNVSADDYFSLLELLISLAEHKLKLVFVPLLAGAAIYGATYALPNTYTGTVQLLPPQGQSGASALLGQLGPLGGLAGGALGGKTSNETYIGMLGSRVVSDELIERFGLAKVYDTVYLSDTRKALKNAVTFTNSRDGMIIIEVDDKDPARAAAMANAYAMTLRKLTQTMAVTEASRRRLFFDTQVELTKEALAKAEVALKETQEKTGMIHLSGQAQSTIEAAASIKAMIASKEVALRAMRSFATTSNPDYQRAEQELAGLRAQLAKVETAPNAGHGDIAIPTSKMPSVALDYARRLRDVKYQEALFEALAKQAELAKIDEAKDSAMVQVLDPAVIPDKKSKPRRALITLVGMLAAFILMLCWAILNSVVVLSKADPVVAERLARLRKSLLPKKTALLKHPSA